MCLFYILSLGVNYARDWGVILEIYIKIDWPKFSAVGIIYQSSRIVFQSRIAQVFDWIRCKYLLCLR